MALRLVVARGSRPTGRILEDLLRERGLFRDGVQGSVSYGVRLPAGTRQLNAQAGTLDKLGQGLRLAERGVRVPEHFTATAQAEGAARQGVLLARKRDHVGGKDIMLVLQASDVQARTRAGAHFFTRFIPSDREYRVWVYRRQHLRTYEKVLAHPERYKKVGRNFDNGFAFNIVRSEVVPREAVELASQAVEALDLDFGAVDIIHGLDGQYYVLEVNTAPGVEGPGRDVIQALADKIARWVELGYPARRGTAEAEANTQRRREERNAQQVTRAVPRQNRPMESRRFGLGRNR